MHLTIKTLTVVEFEEDRRTIGGFAATQRLLLVATTNMRSNTVFM